MAKGQPPKAVAPPPPILTTNADKQFAEEQARMKAKKRYNYADTLLSSPTAAAPVATPPQQTLGVK